MWNLSFVALLKRTTPMSHKWQPKMKNCKRIYTTCLSFGYSVIKNLRKNLIDREYLKDSAALQGAGLQEVVNSKNKSVQAAERV